MTIKLEDLDGLKLVDALNFANLGDVHNALDSAITQGSQTWGVTPTDSVVLRLASELKEALALAATADAAQRALKGTQLELGRVRKQLEIVRANIALTHGE